jgi:thiol-disulfide isomerase/thioredoxin
MMLERGLLALAIVIVLVAGYSLATRYQLGRVSRQKNSNKVLAGLQPGIPAVIYFWSETCLPCKTVQKPALERLQADMGPDSIQIVAINALEQPSIADEWGVLGLPTTFIVDTHGQPRRVNHGVVRADHLREQIKLVG